MWAWCMCVSEMGVVWSGGIDAMRQKLGGALLADCSQYKTPSNRTFHLEMPQGCAIHFHKLEATSSD